METQTEKTSLTDEEKELDAKATGCTFFTVLALILMVSAWISHLIDVMSR